jgi:hypothetical protein
MKLSKYVISDIVSAINTTYIYNEIECDKQFKRSRTLFKKQAEFEKPYE